MNPVPVRVGAPGGARPVVVARTGTVGVRARETRRGSKAIPDATSIGAAEQFRAEKGWVDPSETPVDSPGQLLAEYTPGDLGFDPLGLAPEDPEEFFEMQTKELQNGRLAMIAAAGFLAQEACDGEGIIEHFQG